MLITRFTKVPEPAEDEGKLSYTNFKQVVWHEAFLRILDKLEEFSKMGYCHKCYDEIIRWLFPIILILSADYEELWAMVLYTFHMLLIDCFIEFSCMMCLLRGTKSKCLCPMCLVPLEELSNLSKTFEACTSAQVKHTLAVYHQKKSEGEWILKALGLWPVTVSSKGILLYYSGLTGSKSNHRMFSGRLCTQTHKTLQVLTDSRCSMVVSGDTTYSQRWRLSWKSCHINMRLKSRTSKWSHFLSISGFSLLLQT